jgi:membrane protein DedA with SNARE-associated domain
MTMVADDRLLSILLQHGLLVAVLLIFLGQLGVPTGVPAELALLLAGGYAVQSVMALLEGLAMIVAADILGAIALFLLVRRGSAGLARHFVRASQDDPGWWQRRLRQPGAIFVMRSLPLVRIYGTVGSGLTQVSMRDFLAGTAPAGLIWAGTPLTLGYLLRGHVAPLVAGYPTGRLGLAAAVPGLLMTAWLIRRWRQATAMSRPAPACISNGLRGSRDRGGRRSTAWAPLPAPALRPAPALARGQRSIASTLRTTVTPFP